MSEGERGERWVYERMPDGEVPANYTYLGAGFICDAWNPRVFYRRIPDPVPALEARIAELEGVFRNLSLLVSDGKGFEVESHPDGATILLTEHDGATAYEVETRLSVQDALEWAAEFAASRTQTPAAAKEQ